MVKHMKWTRKLSPEFDKQAHQREEKVKLDKLTQTHTRQNVKLD